MSQPPRRSRRLATILPASDWIGMGFDPDTAQRMEAVQRNIQEACEGDKNTIKLGPGAVVGVAPHHDLMIPHWTKLANSIKSRGAPLDLFYVTRIALSLPVMDGVLPSLHTCGVSEMELLCTDLGRLGILRLSSFLRENTSLIKLRVVREEMAMEEAGPFSGAIRSHPTLQFLSLCDCGLQNDGILRTIVNGCKGLKSVGLWDHPLDSQGVAAVAEFISGDHCVEKLSFLDSNLTDSNAATLAAALRKNSHLLHLDLQENHITDAGRKFLLKAIFDATSMDAIIDSNHSCVVNTFTVGEDESSADYFAQFSDTEVEAIFINKWEISVKEKIRKKAVLALCGGSVFDLGHFNGIPLHLMPLVLKLLQENTAVRTNKESQQTLSRDALSRVFHTLRGWKMPSLFANLHNPHEASRKRKRSVAR